jgi:hypothetical protein
MARAEALRLGPFVGGLNIASDPTAVADSELVVCNNFELDIDGSLIARPPIVETVNLSATWTERINIIGRGSFSGGDYLIGSNTNGTFAFDGNAWTTISASLKSRVALQYNDKMYIVPQPGNGAQGGYWSPGGAFTADTNMPEGEAAVFHKSRMFIVPGISATTNSSRLRFTDPITSTTLTWTSTNLIDVSQGDGQKLIDIIIYNDNLMLFKNDSTYLLAYDIKPSDAILRNINSVIGVTTRNCVVTYENSVYVFHEGEVFEIINYDFTRINLKVPFVFDSSVPASTTRAEEVFLSILGDRLLVRFFNKIYIYGLRTRTWSTWSSVNETLHNFGPLMAFPTNAPQASNTKYYAGSSITQHESVFYILDGYSSTEQEKTLSTNYDISCTIQTKNYDLADSHHFKKLMWWGADILTRRNVTGTATPVIQSFGVTWTQMAANPWSFYTVKTWGQPLTDIPTAITSITYAGDLGRMFVKFLKALRFRQINFTLTLLTTGTTVQGPPRVFTLTAIIGSKQTVTKQVN